jgi:superfamily I DNA and/or RNA helicase
MEQAKERSDRETMREATRVSKEWSVFEFEKRGEKYIEAKGMDWENAELMRNAFKRVKRSRILNGVVNTSIEILGHDNEKDKAELKKAAETIKHAVKVIFVAAMVIGFLLLIVSGM